MALDPSNSSSFEQLAMKGLNGISKMFAFVKRQFGMQSFSGFDGL